MTELAIAAFAAESGSHLVEAPRGARFSAFVERFDEVEYVRSLTAAGARWIGRSQPGFPSRLARIHDPPAGLFVRGSGEVGMLEGPAVAIVGARACSAYGEEVATRLARELAA